jgi:hypothetical protein
MRVSVDPKDPGYSPYACDAVEKVTLDGEVVKNVITADDKLGVVTYYPEDNRGRLLIDGTEVVRINASGTVEIKFKSNINPVFLTGVQ